MVRFGDAYSRSRDMEVNILQNELELSVIMPCLNEAETLETCIKKAQETIKRYGILGEIIIVDNGSIDCSQDIARMCGARVVQVGTKGYGAALLGGINAARGRFIIMGDADDSYDFSNIIGFVEKLREGYDLVMGCRLPSGGGMIMPGAMPWKHRWIGNPALSTIGRLFFKSPVSDFHCGLRAFRKDAIEKLELRTTGMEFASEMVIKATIMGLCITQIPITLYKDGRSIPPHLRSWRDGWRHLRFMLMYSPRWLFLIPGSMLFTISLSFFILLELGPIRIGSIVFDTNTLLVFAMTILFGFQLIAFSIYTKAFAITEGLLPDDPTFKKLCKLITLEVGILTGVSLFLLGFGLIVYGVFNWWKADFGSLSSPESLRITVPGITTSVLGVQIIFSSFFLSILGLSRK